MEAKHYQTVKQPELWGKTMVIWLEVINQTLRADKTLTQTRFITIQILLLTLQTHLDHYHLVHQCGVQYKML
jgi:hypothetical protein